MASTAAIATTRKDALNRLEQSMKIMGEELGVEPVKLTQYNRDAEWLRARQLSEMADYLESLVKALHPVEDARMADVPAGDTSEEATASLYATLTKAELQALADDRELVVTGTGANGNVLVSDLQAALVADDAASEGVQVEGNNDDVSEN